MASRAAVSFSRPSIVRMRTYQICPWTMNTLISRKCTSVVELVFKNFHASSPYTGSVHTAGRSVLQFAVSLGTALCKGEPLLLVKWVYCICLYHLSCSFMGIDIFSNTRERGCVATSVVWLRNVMNKNAITMYVYASVLVRTYVWGWCRYRIRYDNTVSICSWREWTIFISGWICIIRQVFNQLATPLQCIYMFSPATSTFTHLHVHVRVYVHVDLLRRCILLWY